MIPIIILTIQDPDEREYMTGLYIKYNRLMYSEIHKIIHDPWDVEDVLQISLVKLIDKISLLRTFERNRLVSYIISTCRNNAYNYNKKLFSLPECEIEEHDGVDYHSNPLEDSILREENRKILLQAWHALDERSRYFLESKYILEKTDQQIATDINIKASSVRMNLTRARNKLKSIINEAQG